MNNRNKKRNKWLWIGGGLLVIIILMAVVLPRIAPLGAGQTSGAAQPPGTEPGTEETVIVFIGDLASNATASGQVQAQRAAQLALAQSGTVVAVYVQVGDTVAAGAPLLKLDSADLERAVANAQQTLTIQEANLAALLAPATAADMTAALANVASAQAALDDLVAGPSDEEIAAAEADVRAANADVSSAAAQLSRLRAGADAAEIQAAQIQLDLAQTAATRAAEQHSTILVTEPGGFLSQEQLADLEFSARTQALQANANLAAAQEAYNRLLTGDNNSVATAQAQAALAAAQRDVAQANLDILLAGATTAQIAGAEATLAQAQANLAQLQRGPAPGQIVQMETAVSQAQIALQRAEYELANATLTAPFAGLVTAVHIHEDEQASGILVELVDPASLEVVLNVDEIDIGDITGGQEAMITLEAWPEQEITGAVTAIAPAASAEGTAVVTYRVYLSLGAVDLPVLVGMTANASLLAERATDVLLAPNAAIQVDRSSGRYSVNRVVTDAAGSRSFEEVVVTIGLRDGRYTQITSGLQAGDELLVGSTTPRFQFGNGGGGGLFGGN